MIILEGRTSSPELRGDIALATHNLGTKLMRWTSSIDYDRVEVSSLTVCQCSDEVKVSTYLDIQLGPEPGFLTARKKSSAG